MEAFSTLLEARVLVEDWRIEYNTLRPHSALGYPDRLRQDLDHQPPRTLIASGPTTGARSPGQATFALLVQTT